MERLLIFRIGSIGDTVVSLPCFNFIARRYPGVRRTLITDIPALRKAASAESILKNTGLIDDTIYFPATRSLGDIFALRESIRATGAKQLIYVADRVLPSVLRDLAFFHWCGIRDVIGAPLTHDLRVPRLDAATGLLEPEAERLARCLARLGAMDVTDRSLWDLHLKPEEIARADAARGALKDRPFFALNLGGKVASKDWGDANWRALLGLMSKSYGAFGLLFVGSPDESERAQRIASVWRGPTLNLCGALSPRETAAAMRDAKAFIGHDSGPMHLASAVDVRCVCMFGNFNQPRWWHPYGEGHVIVHDMRGVLAVTPVEILAALDSLEVKADTSERADAVPPLRMQPARLH